MCHSKTRSSRGEVPWHSILWQLSHWQQLCTDSCHHSDCRRTRPVHWYLSLPLAKLWFVLCPKTARLCGSTTKYGYGWQWQKLLFCWGTKWDHQAELIDRKSLPSCVLHGGTSTCLRVNLCYHVQFELMGTLRRSTSKTQSKPMAWSDAYKCFVFFFCLLIEMCYFALSLLTHTFLKQQIMWMFTVNGLVFFFCYSKKFNDLWAF